MKGIPAAKQRRLDEIQAKLLDVYILEADPDNWTTAERIREEVRAEQAAGLLDPEEAAKTLKRRLGNIKGDRYWEKKNANQTMALLCRLNSYELQLAGDGDQVDDEKEEKRIATMEKKVAERLALARPRLVSSRK